MILNSPTISGSLTVTGNIITSGSITLSGSVASASYALSASNAQTASFANAFTVAGNLTAQTLVVQTITSSVDYVTGSTRFGSVIGNTHVFTGSIFTSGSINIGTSSSIAGVTLNVQSIPNGVGVLINNPSSASYTGFRIYNDQASAIRSLEMDYAGSAYAGTLLSGGISGEAAAITTTGAYPLQFGTSNTFRMCILSGGNVGIGATNPDQKLSIQAASGYGLISFKSSSGVSTAYIGIPDTSTNVITTSTSGDLCLRVDSTNSILFATAGSSERMRITSGGALCIGLTSSAYGSVSIKSNSTTAYAGFNVYATGNGNFAYVNHDNNRGIIGTEFGTGGTGQTPLAFEAGGSERMRISTGGNILLGSTSDNSLGRLQITGGHLWMNFNTYAYFNSRYSSTTNYGNILFNNGTGQNLWFGETATNIYTFGNGSAGVAISNSVLSMNMSNYYVSIGSSSFPYNFNVYGAAGADGWGAFFGGAGSTKGGIYLGNAGTQYGSLYFDNANNNVYLKQSYASGNVSVIANTGGVYLANGGTSWTAISSDERKKKNFETVPGLNEVLQIEPIKYHFDWEENTKPKRLGFKAQNIQPLIPEMVLETGEIAEDGSPYLTVTPDYILPVLVKAIQELKAQNDDLQSQINELKAQ